MTATRTPRSTAVAPRTGRSALPGGPTGSPGLCSACAAPLRGPSRLAGFAARVTWGLGWRYGLLGAVVVAAESRAGAPWGPLAILLIVGVVLGLWHRPWVVARVWRTLVIAATVVYVGPLTAVYPDVIAGSLGALTLSPFVGAWRRR
jgi:hypothetical protein